MRPSRRRRRPARAFGCERLEPRQLLSVTTSDSGWSNAFTVTDGIGISIADVEVDQAGNRYVLGSFTQGGSPSPGPGGSQKLVLLKFDATGSQAWSQVWYTTASGDFGTDPDGLALGIDRFGGVGIVGTFLGTLDFDPGAGVVSRTAAPGERDLFVLKLLPDGTFQRVTQIAGVNHASCGIVATEDGFVVGGTFVGTVDFDPGPGVDTRSSRTRLDNHLFVPTADVFILKLTAAGTLSWCQVIGGPGEDEFHSLAADAFGNPFVVGGFEGTVDFNPSELGTFNLTGTRFMPDVFALKLTSGGAFQFARLLELGATWDTAQVAVDPTGGVYVAGGYHWPVPQNPGVINTALRLVKLDVVGAEAWTRDFVPSRQAGWPGGGADQLPTFLDACGLGVDAAGSVHVAAILRGTVDLDPGAGVVTRSSQLPSDNTASVVLKISSAGGYVWDRTAFWGDGDEGGSLVLTADRIGNVVVAGAYPQPGIDTSAFVNQIHAAASLLVMSGNGAWTAVASSGSGFTQRQLAAWMPRDGLTNLTAADVDRDGDDDLVGLATDGSWWVGRNDGGTAMVGVRFATPGVGQQLTPLIGDMDGDGRADLVYRAPNTGMWVLRRSTGAEFGSPELLGQWNAAINWSNVALADVDGDGDRDIVGRRPAGDWQVGLYSRSPSSTIVSRVFGNFTSTVNWANLTVVDFDGDGRADVIGRNPATNVWWLGRSDGMAFINIRLGSFTAGVNWSNVGYGDVDGDHDLDVIARNPATGNWVVGRNDGGAAISTVAFGNWPAAVQWQLVTVGDYNGDGRADVVGLNPANGNLRVSLSTGMAFSDVIWARLAGGVAWTTARRVRL